MTEAINAQATCTRNRAGPWPPVIGKLRSTPPRPRFAHLGAPAPARDRIVIASKGQRQNLAWLGEEAAPRALDLGSSLKAVDNLSSFDCRGRNGSVGAKLSEHGKANALDIHSLRLTNGKVVELTDPHVPKDFREGLRKSACAQFTTVLGPGSDGSHEDHIHDDLLERRGGYRICEWDVREPGEAPPAPAFVASVPLPRARPVISSRERERH